MNLVLELKLDLAPHAPWPFLLYVTCGRHEPLTTYYHNHYNHVQYIQRLSPY